MSIGTLEKEQRRTVQFLNDRGCPFGGSSAPPEPVVIWVFWPPEPKILFPCSVAKEVFVVTPESVQEMRRKYGRPSLASTRPCVCGHSGQVIE